MPAAAAAICTANNPIDNSAIAASGSCAKPVLLLLLPGRTATYRMLPSVGPILVPLVPHPTIPTIRTAAPAHVTERTTHVDCTAHFPDHAVAATAPGRCAISIPLLLLLKYVVRRLPWYRPEVMILRVGNKSQTLVPSLLRVTNSLQHSALALLPWRCEPDVLDLLAPLLCYCFKPANMGSSKCY
jgi:hypothetical protein